MHFQVAVDYSLHKNLKTKIVFLHFKEDVDVNKSEIYNILHL